MYKSKEVKEYSDSEKDWKGKEESGGVRALKDSREKQKLDSKYGKYFYGGSRNGDYLKDDSSLKRQKERVDDKASDSGIAAMRITTTTMKFRRSH